MHQNFHNTRLASWAQKQSHTLVIFKDQPKSKSLIHILLLQSSQRNQTLFPENASPIVQKFYTMEKKSKVHIYNANYSCSSMQKSSPRDISNDKCENNRTLLPNNY